MRSMKFSLRTGPATREEGAQPSVGEDALDEVLPQDGVLQPPFLLDREVRVGALERLGEQPAPLSPGHALLAAYLDAFHAAARRVLLQDVATELFPGQRARPPRRPGLHRPGPVATTLGPQHADVVAALREVDGLPWDAHAELDLRAHRHPFHVVREQVREEAVALVPTVPAHLLTEQAGGDADAQRCVVLPEGCRRP
jgi:hypothetical protein